MLPLPVRDGRSRADSLDCENNGHSERARKTMRKAKTGYSVNLAGKAGSAQAQQFLSINSNKTIRFVQLSKVRFCGIIEVVSLNEWGVDI